MFRPHVAILYHKIGLGATQDHPYQHSCSILLQQRKDDLEILHLLLCRIHVIWVIRTKKSSQGATCVASDYIENFQLSEEQERAAPQKHISDNRKLLMRGVTRGALKYRYNTPARQSQCSSMYISNEKNML